MTDLEARMRNVLAQASVIAEMSAAGLNEPTSHGKAGTRAPTIGGESTFDTIRRRLEAAGSPRERLEAVEWAEGLVRDVKRQRAAELTAKQRDYWILEASEGKDYRDVAAEFGMRDTTIYKMRLDDGREPRKGRPKAA